MPLEFALRPRFDLKRPAPRRRLSWLRLHPLVLPVGAYWLAAVGLTYALIRSADADVADAPEQTLLVGDPAHANAHIQPPIQIPDPTVAAVIQRPTGREPEPAWVQEPEPDASPLPLPEPSPDEPLSRRTLDSSQAVAEPRGAPSRQTSPLDDDDDDDEAKVPTRAFEPDAVEALAPRADRDREVEPEPAPRREEQAGALPSCESAAAAANQTIEVGSARGAPDLTRGAFAGVLEHGAYLTPCSIPPRTAIEICAAVQNGAVVGVTVVTEPRDATINGCVRRAVAKLRFPRSPQLDVTRTRFARER